MEDHIDHIIAQWNRERPDLDVSPMAVIARMSRLSRLLERSIAEVLARYGINEPQFGVLAALRRAGPPFRLSPTALYNSLLISSGAMTNRLERLRAAGLVRRIPDPRDGRSVLVALTRKGHRVVDQAVTAHIENEHRLLASLSQQERAELAGLLRKLLIAVEGQVATPRRRSQGRARVGPARVLAPETGGNGQAAPSRRPRRAEVGT